MNPKTFNFLLFKLLYIILFRKTILATKTNTPPSNNKRTFIRELYYILIIFSLLGFLFLIGAILARIIRLIVSFFRKLCPKRNQNSSLEVQNQNQNNNQNATLIIFSLLNFNRKEIIDPLIKELIHFLNQNQIKKAKDFIMSNCLEEIEYNPESDHFHQNCTICLEKFEKSGVAYKTCCNHIFHSFCISKQILMNLKNIMKKNLSQKKIEILCPNCKTNLLIKNKKINKNKITISKNISTNEVNSTNTLDERSKGSNIEIHLQKKQMTIFKI